MKEERPREAARPRPGATRCPYCHEDCEATDDACACADCLSRHHPACWREGSGCASCRGTRKLEVAAKADPHDYASVINAWLKLALVYNGGLVLVTIATLALRAALGGRLRLDLVVEVPFGAIVANVCFMLGPGIDVAAYRLGYRGTGLRAVLFACGFLLALLLAFLSCLL